MHEEIAPVRERKLMETKKPRFKREMHEKVEMTILQRRVLFILIGLALLVGSDLYGRWQVGEEGLWKNTFVMIFTPSKGPRTSAVFSGLLWAFTILIVLPCLFGWGAFKFLYRPVTIYEWKFVSRRKAHVKAYDYGERSFGSGLLPFLVGFVGQVTLGYLVGLAVPLSITMPLGSILLSIGCFGLLSELFART